MSNTGDLKKEAERINKIGDQFLKKKNFKEAIAYYEQSVELAKQAGDNKKAENYSKELDEAVASRAKEINSNADNLLKQKKYKEAMDTYQEAFNMLQDCGEKWVNKFGKEFTSELNKSKVTYAKNILLKDADETANQKKFEEAAKKYEDMLKIVTIDVDKSAYNDLSKSAKKFFENYAQDVNNAGDKAYKEKKFEDAIRLYSESVRLINMSDNEGKKKNFKGELNKAFAEHAQEINNIGDKLMKEGKFPKAAEIYKQSVEIAKEAGNQKLLDNFSKEMEKAYEKFAQSINSKGDELYKQGKFEEAAQFYGNSVNIAKDANNKRLIDNFTGEYNKSLEKWAKTVDANGDAAMKAGKYKEAYDLYDKCVQIAEKWGDKGAIKEYRKERDKAMDKAGIN